MLTLIKFYKNWLGFNQYYNLLVNQKLSESNEFIKSPRFLYGIKNDQKNIPDNDEIPITTQLNDLRIDVPVWFGDLENSKIKIVVLGLEPRDTNSIFNIEKIGNKVFGNPFGVNRWNPKSSIRYKPQNKYFDVFRLLLDRNDVFLLFSDAVKTYEVKENNAESDNYARKIFRKEFENQKNMLLQELDLIKPTHILALGRDTYKKLSSSEINQKYKIFHIRHPAQGGKNIAKNQIETMFIS